MISREQKEYLLPKAYNVALRAGAVINEIYTGEALSTVELKSDMTPITVADRRAHLVIKEYLSHTRIPLLSEEGREMLYSERKDWDLFWMVDPLDGTKEFVKGNGEFTVNIALMVDNIPLFGVIYVPYKRRIYFSDPLLGGFRHIDVAADPSAEYDYDAIFEGAEKLPLKRNEDASWVVAVSRSHKNADTARRIDEFGRRHKECIIVEQGSSYKLCLLAEGSVDFYPRTSPTNEWDTAAGEAIIRASGGVMRTLSDGTALRYNKESLVNPDFECYGVRLLSEYESTDGARLVPEMAL